jgi:hypothetical protein
MNHFCFLVTFGLFVLLPTSKAELGIELTNGDLTTDFDDFAHNDNQKAWKCLRDKGFDFAVIAFEGASAITRARKAGFSDIDGEISPTYNWVNDVYNNVDFQIRLLKLEKETVNRIWVKIYGQEKLPLGAPTHWNYYPENNVPLIKQVILTLKESNNSVGIFTNKDQWDLITGNFDIVFWYKSSFGIDLPLWELVNDGKADETDFTPFGGWTNRFMKQYESFSFQYQCGMAETNGDWRGTSASQSTVSAISDAKTNPHSDASTATPNSELKTTSGSPKSITSSGVAQGYDFRLLNIICMFTIFAQTMQRF